MTLPPKYNGIARRIDLAEQQRRPARRYVWVERYETPEQAVGAHLIRYPADSECELITVGWRAIGADELAEGGPVQ